MHHYKKKKKENFKVKIYFFFSPFYRAVKHGQVEQVRLIGQSTAKIDMKDSDWWTALHWAAREGHVGIVNMLVVEYGADLNAKDNLCSIPLHFAAENGHVEVVKVLVE